MSFAVTWMDLEFIILSEVRKRKTNIMGYHLHMESKVNNDTNELIYETETDSNFEKKNTYQRGNVGGKDKLGILD